MLYLTKPKKIYLYCRAVDFRKQMNGLCQIVESEFERGSLQSSWFVFISRDKHKVKLLYWRGSGLAMWQYRLEEDLFQMSRPRPLSTKHISWKDLRRFLDGYNIFEGEAHKQTKVKRYS